MAGYVIHDAFADASAPPLPPFDPDSEHARIEEQLLPRDALMVTEGEALQLVEKHVSKQFLWSMKPIRHARVLRMEDCSGYRATLETFVESRTLAFETVAAGTYPDGGDEAVKRAPGPAPSPWDFAVDHLRPPPFTAAKEVALPLLYTKKESKCSKCTGEGRVQCGDRECTGIGRPKKCVSCRGSGFTDLSEFGAGRKENVPSVQCHTCSGTGSVPCQTCRSYGYVPCTTCKGSGKVVSLEVLRVKWTTVKSQKEVTLHPVTSERPLALLRADRGQGQLLFREEAQDCQPVLFRDLDRAVAQLSAKVVADRVSVDGRTRRLRERHSIYLVPATGMLMSHDNKDFEAFVYGLDKQVVVENYPARFAPLERCVVM